MAYQADLWCYCGPVKYDLHSASPVQTGVASAPPLLVSI